MIGQTGHHVLTVLALLGAGLEGVPLEAPE